MPKMRLANPESFNEAKERELAAREEMLQYKMELADARLKIVDLEEEKANRPISSKSCYLISKRKSERCSELLGGKGSMNDRLYHNALMKKIQMDLYLGGYLELTMYDAKESFLLPTLSFITRYEPDGDISKWITDQENKRVKAATKQNLSGREKKPEKPTYYVGIDCPIDTF